MNMNVEALKMQVKLPDFVRNLPKIAVAAGISGLIVAALILMTPNPWFEAFITETGLPSVISAAELPLGARARIVFALIAALLVTIAAWVALTVFLGRRPATDDHYRDMDYDREDQPTERPAPVLRSADAHPDYPPRAPIMAGNDLGTPLDLVDVVFDDEQAEEEIVAPVSDFADADDFSESVESAISDAPGLQEPIFQVPLRSSASEQPADYVEPEREAPVAMAPTWSVPNAIVDDEIADLIVRLEVGLNHRLERKKAGSASEAKERVLTPASDPSAPESDAEPNMDSTLRDALDALQRVTGKGS